MTYYNRPKIKIEGLNSVYDEPNISSTIKENPYAANVELEGKGKGRKGEVVLRPDGEALHDVVGKRHYAGGVETWLPEGSFVFSDYKDLALNKRDHELFELKEGGSYKKSDNTPAEVLRRNIDVKHYNKMSETLVNKYKDPISKKTAELMLSKYQEKLGQIALLQESKKGFSEGVPAFSQGTAPVYENEFKEDIMEQKQYMRFGGNVLPKFQMGRNSFIMNLLPPKKAEVAASVDNEQTIIGANNNTQSSRLSGADQGNVTGFENPYIQGSSSFEQYLPKQQYCPPGYYKDQSGNCVPFGRYKEPEKREMPPEVEAGTGSPVEMPWRFTPWQKYSMGLGFKNYAGINRLMPMRSQINSPLVELERMVEPSYLGELASGFRANQVMNPYLAGANNNQMFGQMLNADRQSTVGNINANAQIANQQNMMNNQIQRQDLQTNIGADQQYYNQVQQSRGNFDNLRSAVREQNRGELMGNVQTNEQLAMAMARMGKDRPFDYNFRTGQIWHTGKGDIMSTQTGAGDILQQYLSKIKFENLSPELQLKYIAELQKNKGLGLLAQASNRKMGGYNPYRRR